MNLGAPIAWGFYIGILLVGLHEWWIERKHRQWVQRQRERDLQTLGRAARGIPADWENDYLELEQLSTFDAVNWS